MKRYFRKFIKFVAWLIAGIIALLILVAILIQIPSVQNFAKNKAVSYLQEKLHTKVSIDRLRIRFPKQIVIQGVYLEDQQKDTLLYAGNIQVDISMWRLLKSELNVSNIELENVRANIHRLQPDTVFNYQFIADAFSSGPDTTSAKEEGDSGMKIVLGNIRLKNIAATFRDDATGMDMHCRLGYFETRITDFDLDKNKYAVSKITLQNIESGFRQYTPLVHLTAPVAEEKDSSRKEESSSPPLSIRLPIAQLNKVSFRYDDETSSSSQLYQVGDLELVTDYINLDSLVFRVSSLKLDSSFAGIHFGKSPVLKSPAAGTTSVITSKDTSTVYWHFEVKDIELRGNKFVFDDDNSAPVSKGMDYSHLGLSNIDLQASTIIASTNQYSGTIQNLSLEEKSGLKLRRMSTKAFYNNHEAWMKDLVLQTENSVVNSQLALKYNSVDDFSNNLGSVFIDASFKETAISVNDVLAGAPMLSAQMGKFANNVIHLDAAISGNVDNLHIPDFEVSGLGNTGLKMKGDIQGLPDVNKAFCDLTIDRFTTSRADIMALVPPKTMPDSIRIPDRLSVNGTLKGSMDAIAANLRINTTNGNAQIKGDWDNRSEQYTVNAEVDSLDIGYILMQEKNFGKVSLALMAKGKGYDYKTMKAELDAKLLSANVYGYTYQDLSLNGTIANGVVEAKADMDDKNIRFGLHTSGDISTAYPSPLQLSLRLDTLNLQALHLTDTPMVVKGLITANFSNAHPDSLNGILLVKDLSISLDSATYHTDSIVVTAKREADQQEIALWSEMATAKMAGHYNITETGQALMHTINQYYPLPSFKDTAFTPQDWQLDFKLFTAPLLLKLQPDLKGTDTLIGKIAFNSNDNLLDAAIHTAKLKYGEQEIDNLQIVVKPENNGLNYALNLDRAGSKSFRIYKTSLEGTVNKDAITTSLRVKDKKEKVQYRLGGKLNVLEDGLRFMLDSDSLKLNYDEWQMAKDNYIQYDSSGIIVNNFLLSKAGESLKINSETLTPTSPINVEFDNFRIKTITGFAGQDTTMVNGMINGKATVKNVLTDPLFTSDIAVENIVFQKDSVGSIIVKIMNENANVYDADVKITGNKNDIQLGGKYYVGDSKMALSLLINRFNLASVLPFSAGQLKTAGGELQGKLDITGTVTQPSVNGNIHFIGASVTPTLLGERFTIPDATIGIDGKGVHFNNFTLADSANNKTIISGDLLTSDFRNYGFNMDINADNFRLVNSTQADNHLFFGKLNIDADIKLRGSMDVPSVNADLHINRQTDLSFILPSDDPELEEREGVVNFIDMRQMKDSLFVQKKKDTLVLENVEALAGMNITANIETDSSAQFTLVIDERNGDALKIKGKAELSGGIDESGKMSLTGNYVLSDGSYQVTISLLKRKFNVRSGSTITWTGDPTSANVDITAVYTVSAPPIDLVQDQISGLPQSEVDQYKQKLPFSVLLKMQGQLMKPRISFDITLPDDVAAQWKDVTTKLDQLHNDESEMNKQVFALLLLSRFVQESSLQSAAGANTASDMVKQSVSRIMTDQLNQLAGSLIKGVDLNFGFNTTDDYSSGEKQNRTDLTVGMSKSLLNDRLKVNVGSNFALEGEGAGSGQHSSNIAGDVSIDYKLSKDGRYALRAYRVNKYEGAVEGQVVETGLKFVLTFDYDEFKELFKKAQKPQQKKK